MTTQPTTPATWSGEAQFLDHFAETTTQKTITVAPDAQVTYLFVVSGPGKVDLTVNCTGEQSSVDIRGIYLATDAGAIESTVQVNLNGNQASADVHLVSFLKNKSDLKVDGSVEIAPQTSGCSGHLLEENIILGERIKLKTLPKLDVRSSDVEASHGARIHKLDTNKLFYMRSKGLNNQQATKLLIEGYLNQLFVSFDDDRANKLREDLLSSIV